MITLRTFLKSTAAGLVASSMAAYALAPLTIGIGTFSYHALSPEVPYTILLDAYRNVLYQADKLVDQLKLRRTILANLPSAYIGLNNYWLEK